MLSLRTVSDFWASELMAVRLSRYLYLVCSQSGLTSARRHSLVFFLGVFYCALVVPILHIVLRLKLSKVMLPSPYCLHSHRVAFRQPYSVRLPALGVRGAWPVALIVNQHHLIHHSSRRRIAFNQVWTYHCLILITRRSIRCTSMPVSIPRIGPLFPNNLYVYLSKILHQANKSLVAERGPSLDNSRGIDDPSEANTSILSIS